MFYFPVVFLDVIAWMRFSSMIEGEKVSLHAYLCFMVVWVFVTVNLVFLDDVMQFMAIYENLCDAACYMVLHDSILKIWFKVQIFSDYLRKHATLGLCTKKCSMSPFVYVVVDKLLVCIGVLCIDLFLLLMIVCKLM